MIIADINPEYATAGKPNRQMQFPPLELVAHLPIIESTGPLGVWQKRDYNRCCCKRFAQRDTRVSLDASTLIADFVKTIEALKSPTKKNYTYKQINELLGQLSKWVSDDEWIKQRAEAYKQHASALPAPFLPPTLVDWLYIDLSKIESVIDAHSITDEEDREHALQQASHSFPQLHVPPYRILPGDVLPIESDDEG